MKEPMFYVAENPLQPGTAWAACVDDPEYARSTAKDVASWIRRGAIIQRVDAETMKRMFAARRELSS